MNASPNEIIVKSWSEFCDALYVDSWNKNIHRFRTDYAFRGIADRLSELKTGFSINCKNHQNLEYHLLRNFKKYAQVTDLRLLSNDWRVMTLAQHYGLPTRLLDWTYSPFVAAHYATCDIDKYDKDGVIWLVNYVEVNKLLPEPFKTVLTHEMSNAFTIEKIEAAVASLDEFDHLSDEVLLLFFEPPSIDARIVNQFAFFSVMSNSVVTMDSWLNKHPKLYKRIIIPKELKWEIRDKLDQANITERIINARARWAGQMAWTALYHKTR